MKILFVGSEVTKKNSGGAYVSTRNFENILEIFGESNVKGILLGEEVEKYKDIDVEYRNKNSSKLKKILDALKFYSGGLDKISEKLIIEEISKNKYDYLFLDLSLYGRVIKKIKKIDEKIKIITFFHNFEVNYLKTMVKISGLKYLIALPSYFFNEFQAMKYSDEIIFLNNRDKNEIFSYYKHIKNNYTLLPVTFKNDYINKQNKEKIKNSEKNILFVGSLFFANLEGIKWFVENIFPHLDNVNIRIVGKNMETKRIELEKYKGIKVVGTVLDIAKEYEAADCIIAPILSGSGMKVKTAEALKYGKKIFGTTEAFQGYDIFGINSCIVCNSENEFIKKLNLFSKEKNNQKYYECSRNLFETKYSYESSIRIFNNLFLRNIDE